MAFCNVITAKIDSLSAVVGTDSLKVAEYYIPASQIDLNNRFDEFINLSTSATAGRI